MATQDILKQYDIVMRLGEGGMGEVYRAVDRRLGRSVAIKILPPLAADSMRRFQREAKSAAALNHPNIVTLYEVGESQGTPYLVMELIQGTTLRDLLIAGPLPIRKVINVGVQIAEALAVAHRAGIVHRDLKPENIMLTDEGFLKILDFGLAKEVSDAEPHGPAQIIGTFGYMAPEQLVDRSVDSRADQFALGAILYELLTGKPPFAGDSAIETITAVLHEQPEPIRKVEPDVPPRLAATIDQLLRKSPDERYASTDEIAHDLRQLAAVQAEGMKSPDAELGAVLDELLVDATDLLVDAKSYRTRLRDYEDWAKTFPDRSIRPRES